jgi:hypothetical protein
MVLGLIDTIQVVEEEKEVTKVIEGKSTEKKLSNSLDKYNIYISLSSNLKKPFLRILELGITKDDVLVQHTMYSMSLLHQAVWSAVTTKIATSCIYPRYWRLEYIVELPVVMIFVGMPCGYQQSLKTLLDIIVTW